MTHSTSVRTMTFLSVSFLTVGYVLAAGVGYYEVLSVWYSIPAIAGLLGGALLSLWTMYLMVWKVGDTIRRVTSNPSY